MTQPTRKRGTFSKAIADYRWSTAITFIALFLWVLIITAKMIAPFVIAVIVGSTLALFLKPIHRKLLRMGWRPGLSGGAVTVVFALLVIGPIATFTAIGAKQGMSIAQRVSEERSISYGAVANHLNGYPIVRLLYGDAAAIQSRLQSTTTKVAQYASTTLLATVAALPGFALQTALTLLACFFVLVDGRRFSVWMIKSMSMDWDVRERLFASFRDTAVSVVLASVAAASTQAVLMFLAFTSLGVPGGFFAAGVTFLFAWVPLLGSTPVWLLGAVYLYSEAQTTQMIILVLSGLLIGVADNWVRVWVLQGRDEMHPLASLVAIFGGISMFGILGVLIGPILIAILSALFRTWPIVHQRFLATAHRDAA